MREDGTPFPVSRYAFEELFAAWDGSREGSPSRDDLVGALRASVPVWLAEAEQSRDRAQSLRGWWPRLQRHCLRLRVRLHDLPEPEEAADEPPDAGEAEDEGAAADVASSSDEFGDGA